MGTDGQARAFEWAAGALLEIGAFASLAEAQATLPGGSYTTLRTYDGCRILRLEQHRRRLLESLPADMAADRLPADHLTSAIRAALVATHHPESRIRLTLAPPRLFLCVERFTPLLPELRRSGVSCATFPLHRDRPHAKDTRFIDTAARIYASLPPGVHEALMVDSDDSLLEGLSSNFFAVVDGELRTETERALLGVTRSLVLEVARGVSSVREQAIRRQDLPRVSECFITSVSREVLPVTRIDDVVVGTGRPGPVTTEIQRRFADLVSREAVAV